MNPRHFSRLAGGLGGLGVLGVLGLGTAACAGLEAWTPTTERHAGGARLEITLLPDQERQTIRSFGASDAWSIQFVGRNWPVEKRERIADLLFSLERHDDGSPRGIGLSAWRFNIGAGSAEQGDASGIADEWRRAESFLQEDGSFDGRRHAGQRWFLRAAKERGVEQFIGFVNSPPVHFTRNGKAYSSGGASANLAADRYDDFAEFLKEVVVSLEQHDDVRLSYLSPVNEPQWEWEGGRGASTQEGSPWLNSEIRGVVGTISRVFRAADLRTEIELTEAGKLNYLYEDGDRPGRGDQVAAFFAEASPDYVGGLPNVARKIAAHGYFTTYGPETLRDVRTRVRARIEEVDPGLEFWMSEYCVLENNAEIRGRERDLGMRTALYVARVIHADLTIANASSWQWWLGVSPYDYKDGLVYIDHDKHDGEVYQSKLLWTLGHFSRFVRPGMRRIEVSRSGMEPGEDLADGVLVSAYKDPRTQGLVTVLVNQREHEVPVRLTTGSPRRYRYYLTTGEPGMDLRFQGTKHSSQVMRVPPQSVVTAVVE